MTAENTRICPNCKGVQIYIRPPGWGAEARWQCQNPECPTNKNKTKPGQ